MTDIAYVRYQQPDLDLAERFLHDFGMTTVSRVPGTLRMRTAHGYAQAYVAHQGPVSCFLSTGIVVDAAQWRDAASWPEAVRVDAEPRFPGDATLTVRDPDGYEYDLLATPEHAPPLPIAPPAGFNFGTYKTRCNAMRIAAPRPPAVLRLGHVALKVADVARSVEWYRRRFGLVVSDLIHDGDECNIVTAFLRCDLGGDFADHHVIALAQASPAAIHHASFEVQDLDEVAAGGQWLERCGYERLWGVGRHLLGGQIFDYWRDPWGNNLEHYTDGDVFNNEAQPGLHAQSADTLYQWGPPLPAHFGD
jgi:catechol 2,3-dioxygenase-like lactoylglutathione lyase family enzyme